VLSCLVVVPCLWQPHVESADLSSHLYNAWLALLISQGKLPGLWIEPKWTNVLVDKLLAFSMQLFGPAGAEKIISCLCVLLFFWAAWHLAAAFNKKPPPLSIVILLLPFTYGVIFLLGLFNYYLSVALCFAALAAFLKRTFPSLLIAAILLLVAFYAQPLPVLWAAACALYILAARRIRPPMRPALLGACILSLVLIRFILVHSFDGAWNFRQIVRALGPDQLGALDLSFRLRLIVRDVLLLSWAAMFIWLGRRYGLIRMALNTVLHLYALTALAAFLMPANLLFPMYELDYSGITQRFSLIAAVLGCCLFARAPENKWRRFASALLALAYFTVLFANVRSMNRTEQQVDALVARLPAGQRVLSNLLVWADPVPRACIGRCFVFNNYETASRQFRVRASPGNSFAQWTYKESAEAQLSKVWRELPVYEFYSCGSDVCMRELPPSGSR